MPQELKAFTVNMKTMDQDIEDPIVAGAGDANGRTFRLIFTQEAAAQLTPETKVYLSWHHKQADVSGLQVFEHVKDEPPIWEIRWPRTMLYEGDVMCCVKLVDSISVVQSTNFIVHVLSDPDDGCGFVVSDDYSIFQKAVIDLTSLSDEMRAQMDEQAREFGEMKSEFQNLEGKVNEAYDKASDAYDLAQSALDQVVSKDTSQGVYLFNFN